MNEGARANGKRERERQGKDVRRSVAKVAGGKDAQACPGSWELGAGSRALGG
jgi:hypothetical protein